MKAPLTTTELENMAAHGCGNPLCTHEHDGRVYLTQRCCHSKYGVSVSYTKGERFLRIVCRRCNKPVGEVAVAGGIAE